MTGLRQYLTLGGVAATLAGGCYFLLAVEVPPEPMPTDLVVFLDVSQSLSLEDVKAQADAAFDYIKNASFPETGTFRIFVADRDLERNEAVSGLKTKARYPEDVEKRNLLLDGLRQKLHDWIAAYLKVNSTRKHTCLMKTLQVAPQLFDSSAAPTKRQVLFVSDMVEDCENQGTPRTNEALVERIAGASERFPLGNLAGINVMAIVPASQDGTEIDWLRRAWEDKVAAAGGQFKIGRLSSFLVSPR